MTAITRQFNLWIKKAVTPMANAMVTISADITMPTWPGSSCRLSAITPTIPGRITMVKAPMVPR